MFCKKCNVDRFLNITPPNVKVVRHFSA